MTAYTGTNASATTGALIPARTGTASADTVPAGALVVWRNSGAGTHTITLGNNQAIDGLAVAGRTIPMAAGTVYAGRINPAWGDANGNVSVGIDGTASEVVYYILGGI